MNANAPVDQNLKRWGWLLYWLFVLALCVITALRVSALYRLDQRTAGLLSLLSGLCVAGGVCAWCHFDAHERGFRLSDHLWIGLAILGPIVVPVYFVRSRGFKAAAKTGFGLFLYVPFVTLAGAVWLVTGLILYYS